MGTFGYISSIALFCYVFMMLIFSGAKKNKLVNSFLMILMAMIAWTGGSFFMRIQLWPSYILWYHVSIAGLMMLPYSYFRFVSIYINKENKKLDRLYFIMLSAVTLINIPKGSLLRWPNIIETGNSVQFVYDAIDWKVIILFGAAGIVVLHMFYLLISAVLKNKNQLKQIQWIFAGIAILFLGHIILMVPAFAGFPVDILSGILNAACLMYALVRKRLFQLRFLASTELCYGIGLTFSLILFYNFAPYLNSFLRDNFLWNEDSYLLVNVLFYVGLLSILVAIWRSISNNVFVRDDLLQTEILKEFSANISKNLDLQSTVKEIISVIQKTLRVRHIYICVPNHEGTGYEMLYSNQPLHDRSFFIKNDNPIISWLKSSEESVLIKDFYSTTEYKSMWESEKKQLQDLKLECCLSLKEESELAGIVLLSGKEENKHVSYADLNFLSSVSAIASISLKNARLYEKVYLEARTDVLTGILNRRYFYELLEKEFDAKAENALSLVILNVDDFKLYNQLYGVKEADEALKKIAVVLQASVGNQGYVARYSGKEFAILLPKYDVYAAKVLTESILKQIREINKAPVDGYKMQTITCSAGISVAPYGAKTVKELLDNADMAVFHVKHKGKNGIMVFDTFLEGEKTEQKKHESVYKEYESTIYALTAAIDAKDHYTFTHSNNVAYYATELGRVIGLNEETVEILRESALLHDVGKIGISEAVLNKPGKLTAEEYEEIKGHVEASIGIIRHLPSLDYVIPAVIGHHERYDGRGYPRGIAGEDIPLHARILCVADSFDAITSKRCYKDAVDLQRTFDIMYEEAGKQFDPYLAVQFVQAIKDGKIRFLANSRGER